MNKFKKAVMILAVAMFGSAVAVPALAYAHSESESASTVKAEAEHKTKDMVEQFRKAAQEKNAEVKNKVKEKSAEARQKACTARKDAMENRLSNKVAMAKKHKEVFDKIFTRVKTFHDSKSLNTENYDALVDAVETAQTNAASQIAALEAIDINVDCTQATVVDTVSTFREALRSTRDSLKAYQTALKNLIVAVHQSAKDVKSSTEGNQ